MAWKTIYIEFEKYNKCKNNSYIFYMPDGIGYDGYSFFHPSKLVDFYENDIVMTVSDEWVFTLRKTIRNDEGKYEVKDTQYLKLEDFENLMSSIPMVYVPPELEPLEDVEALEELIDE